MFQASKSVGFERWNTGHRDLCFPRHGEAAPGKRIVFSFFACKRRNSARLLPHRYYQIYRAKRKGDRHDDVGGLLVAGEQRLESGAGKDPDEVAHRPREHEKDADADEPRP